MDSAASVDSGAPQGGSSSELLDSLFDTPGSDDTGTEQGGEGDEPGQLAEGEVDPLADVFGEEDPEPEQIVEQGRNAYKMSEARMNRLVAARKLADGIQEFAPNVEAAREHYQRANDFGTMESDFRNPFENVQVTGEDGQMREMPAARAFLEHWAGVSPEGMGAVAEMLPQFLAESGNTRALAAIENRVINANIAGAYQRAARSGDPEDLAKAQNLDFALTGKFKQSVEPLQPRQNNDLQVREQQLQQREDRIVNDQWKQFNSQHLEGARNRALDAQLDGLFERPRVKESFGAEVLSALRDRVAVKLKENLQKDGEWSRNDQIQMREIQSAYTKALRSNQQTNLTPVAQRLVDAYTNKVKSQLIAVAKPLFADATGRVVKNNQALHQRSAISSGKTVPSGGGPVRRSIVPTAKGRNSMDLLTDALG